jgi:hypothetical protein
MAAQIDDAFILRWMRRLNANPTKHCFGDLNDCDRERKLLHATVLVAHNLVWEGSQDARRNKDTGSPLDMRVSMLGSVQLPIHVFSKAC